MGCVPAIESLAAGTMLNAVESVVGQVLAAGLVGSRRLWCPGEKIGEDQDGIGDVDSGIVVAVACVLARRARGEPEQEAQDPHRVPDVVGAVPSAITASKQVGRHLEL